MEGSKRYRYAFLSTIIAFLLIFSLGATANFGIKNAYADYVLKTITIPLQPVLYGPAHINQIAVNPVTNMVYVLDSWGVGMTNEENITVINGTTNQVTATLGSFYSEDTDAIAVNPSTNQVLLNTRWTTYVIDGRNNNVTESIDSSHLLGYVPFGLIAVNPVTDMLYRSAPELEVFNISSGSLEAMLNIGGCQILGMAANSVTNMIYIIGTCGPNDNYYAVVNGTTNTLARNMTSLPVASLSGGIAVNPVTNLVYFSGGEINGTTNSFVSDNRFNITESVAVNSNTNLVYVTNGQHGLNIFNASTGELVQNLTVENGPHYIAMDQTSGRTYVSNGGSDTVSVIEGGIIASSTTSTFGSSTSTALQSTTVTQTSSSASPISSSTASASSIQSMTTSSSSSSSPPPAPPPPASQNNSNYYIIAALIAAVVIVAIGIGIFAILKWSGREPF